MARKIEDMIKPFSSMSADEQLGLIAKVRFARFTVKPSKVKTAKKKTTTKQTAKKNDRAVKAISLLSASDKAALIAKLTEAKNEK